MDTVQWSAQYEGHGGAARRFPALLTGTARRRLAPPARRSGSDDRGMLRVLHHEFRTPVASLEALAGALSSGAVADDADQREIAGLIAAHAHHLADLLEAVRIVAQSLDPLRGGRLPEPVDTCQLIEAAASAAGFARGTVHVDVAADVQRLMIVAADVRRVLTNLLENARVHGGGPVCVQVERLRGRPGPVRFVVADGGRADATRAPRPGPHGPPPGDDVPLPVGAGGGLGLWIVEQLVRAGGGCLECLPAAGGYVTRVGVRLPV